MNLAEITRYYQGIKHVINPELHVADMGCGIADTGAFIHICVFSKHIIHPMLKRPILVLTFHSDDTIVLTTRSNPVGVSIGIIEDKGVPQTQVRRVSVLDKVSEILKVNKYAL